MREHFFATCPRGLEQILVLELEELGGDDIHFTAGGVSFSGDLAVCYKANLGSRVASRVLWRISRGVYRDEQDIYAAAIDIPWQRFFDPRCTIRVKVSAIASPLKSLDFATLRIKDAVCDRFRAETGARPSVDKIKPDIRVYAFLDAKNITIYLDTSGEPLFKRDLKESVGEAPLRANLAAGILRLAKWQPGLPLLDPMCGSGTLLIEAIQMSLGVPPGSARHFAFEKLKNFQATQWDAIRGIASQTLSVNPLGIWGGDLLGSQLKIAKENLARAGLSHAANLKQANILELSPPASDGMLITNLPYGVRMGKREDLAVFYPQFGDVLKRKFAGWRAYLFTGDLRLPKLIGLKPSRRLPLYNGPIECRLYEFDLVAGSHRREKKVPSAALGQP